MKKIILLILLGLLILPACEEEDSCDDTIIPQYTAKITVLIKVKNSEGYDQVYYPVRYIMEKIFCDGDVGFPIKQNGETNAAGEYYGNVWDVPFTNSKDEVSVYFYAGPGYSEVVYSETISYNDVKNNQWAYLSAHTFIIDR